MMLTVLLWETSVMTLKSERLKKEGSQRASPADKQRASFQLNSAHLKDGGKKAVTIAKKSVLLFSFDILII